MAVIAGISTRTSLGKKIFEIEEKIIDDFSFEEKSILQNIENFNLDEIDFNHSNIQYSVLFDPTNIKKIESTSFQESINDYLNRVETIYNDFSFLEKGKFTLPKLIEIQKRLRANKFYEKDNRIALEGIDELHDEKTLQTRIAQLTEIISDTTEFKKIEKLLSDSKGMQLKDIIEDNPEIIEELSNNRIKNFRRKIWLSYFKESRAEFDNLLDKYVEFKERISDINRDSTPWNQALKIFNNRFSLPFRMEIENLTSSIIGESLPKVVFSFNKNNDLEDQNPDNWVKLSRNELDDIDTLSQGEKRALYLLNIIFDIEYRKNNNIPTIFIVDDIADSFDYKNKYAIVEYINDILKEDQFRMLFLTHNYDFYRTVASRMNIDRTNRHEARIISNNVIIDSEVYQSRPFDNWKAVLKARSRYNKQYTVIDAKKHIIALIPFIRNLIEFGIDKNIGEIPGIDKDYLLLTSLLHLKEKTNDIDIRNLKLLFREYIGKDDFDRSISDDSKIVNIIFDLVENHVSEESFSLENKILLSIGIRLKSEEFMIRMINNPAIYDEIRGKGNQTRVLYNKYKEMFIDKKENLRILESVNILTPENIHLNSFMYEPILDMDIVELKKLYGKVTSLR